MASRPTTDRSANRWSLLTTRVGRRVFLLFVLSALVPLGGMAVVSYRNVSGHIEELAERRVSETAKAAGMALIERLSAADAQLFDQMGRETGGEPRFIEHVEQAPVEAYASTELDEESWQRLRGGQPLLTFVPRGPAAMELQLLRLDEKAETIFSATLRTDSILASSRIYAQTQYGEGICVISGGGLRLGCDRALESGFEAGHLPLELGHRGFLQWEDGDGDFIAGYWTAFLSAGFGSPGLTVAVAEGGEGLRVPGRAFSSAFLLAAALCLFAVLLSSTIVIRRSLAPLEELKGAADRVGEARFETKVEIHSGDEFEDLGAAFNQMSARIESQLGELEHLYVGTIRALARAIDAASPWTRGHSERVAQVSVAIAAEMGLGQDELELIYRGGLLHDVGKIGVPADVLDKPGRLTEDELDAVRAHPVIGVSILEPVEQLANVLPMVRSHHEQVDGSGYPDGLVGEEIHLHARIMAVADVWDAITSNRPYRPAMPFDEAWGVISRGSGSHFDGAAVTAFEGIARNWYQRMDEDPSPEVALGAATVAW